jgi:hypothetical protein
LQQLEGYITVLSFTSNTFIKIVVARLMAALEKDFRPQQAGFCPGRLYLEHIFTLRQILEQSNEWNMLLYISVIDFKFGEGALWCSSLIQGHAV